jgi:hypothetical protein
MADLSESDYGMLDYGDGHYSLRPIWLFESAVQIPVNISSDFIVLAFRGFEATVNISVDAKSLFGVSYVFGSNASISFGSISDMYFGTFWKGWTPLTGGDGPWQPVGPDMRPNKPWLTL